MQEKEKLYGKECCQAKPWHTSKRRTWAWNVS